MRNQFLVWFCGRNPPREQPHMYGNACTALGCVLLLCCAHSFAQDEAMNRDEPTSGKASAGEAHCSQIGCGSIESTTFRATRSSTIA